MVLLDGIYKAAVRVIASALTFALIKSIMLIDFM